MTIRAAEQGRGADRGVRRDGGRGASSRACCSGFGLRNFSMHPAQLLAVKQQVLRSSIPEVEVLTQRILRSEEAERTRGLLAKLNA